MLSNTRCFSWLDDNKITWEGHMGAVATVTLVLGHRSSCRNFALWSIYLEMESFYTSHKDLLQRMYIMHNSVNTNCNYKKAHADPRKTDQALGSKTQSQKEASSQIFDWHAHWDTGLLMHHHPTPVAARVDRSTHHVLLLRSVLSYLVAIENTLTDTNVDR